MKRFFSVPLLLGAALFVALGCSDPVSPDVSARTIEAPVAVAAQSADELSRRSAGQQSNTMVDVAPAVNQQSGEFSILIAALLRAEFVEALQAKRQLTVFAPSALTR